MPAGQWFRSDTGVKWFFDAGSPALDFAYLGGTFGVGADSAEGATDTPANGFGPACGLPASGWDGLLLPAALDAWLTERFAGLASPGTPPSTERELADARALRDAIGRLALAAADGYLPVKTGLGADDIDTLNLFAALPDIPPALGGGRRQAGAGRLRTGQALSSIAREAVRLFGAVGFDGASGSRLHRCEAADCRLIFLDESRGASRRWCSMQKCGNRAKVRAHRARAAGGT